MKNTCTAFGTIAVIIILAASFIGGGACGGGNDSKDTAPAETGPSITMTEIATVRTALGGSCVHRRHISL